MCSLPTQLMTETALCIGPVEIIVGSLLFFTVGIVLRHLVVTPVRKTKTPPTPAKKGPVVLW